MTMFLTDPNIVFLLLTLGLFALVFEVAVPGGFISGITGTVLLLAGGYALTMIPFSIFGLLLLTVGIATMAAEAFVITKGLLAFTGAVIFAIGAVFLFDSPDPALRLSWITIASTTIFIGGGMTFLLAYAVRLYKRKPALHFGLEGQKALIVDWNDDVKRVEADGAFWQARSLSNCSYAHGDWVIIQGQDNITLLIE